MKPSWFFGIGATTREKALACVMGSIGVGFLCWQARDLGWAWWQYVIGGLVAFDLVGGVIANGLRSTKRFYQGPLVFRPTRLNRLLHNPIGLTAVHVQPIVIGLLFGSAWRGALWGTLWGLLWYAWALGGVVLVRWSPRSLARPVALFVVVSGTFAALALAAPPAFEWLPTILLLKLVLAHAVPEEVS